MEVDLYGKWSRAAWHKHYSVTAVQEKKTAWRSAFLNQHTSKEVWVCMWRRGCRTVLAMRSRSYSAFTHSLIKYTATFMRWCSVSLFISHLFLPYFPATSRNEEGWRDWVLSFWASLLQLQLWTLTPSHFGYHVAECWMNHCFIFC